MGDVNIFVVGSHKNAFLEFENRTKFFREDFHTEPQIDDRNPWYCEITGLYYAWKHDNSSIKGLEHYRRYFGSSKTRHALMEDEIKQILQTNDMIAISCSDNIGPTLEWRFIRGFANGSLLNELNLLKTVIQKIHPNYYEIFKNFIHFNTHYQFNMLIAKKELFDRYCEWLFEILENVWQNKEVLKPRSIGYLSEIILLTFFIYINKLKVYNAPLIYVR